MRRMISDGELVARTAGGDREAFGLLLERHYDRIYRLAYRLCGNPTDAEDIAHDVCIGLPRKLRSFKGEARFTTWLYRVVMNAGRDFLRRRAAMNRAHADYTGIADLKRVVDDDTKTEMAWVYEALNAMGADLKETALLVVAEGLSHAEAAEVLGVKEATISWRMHAIRKRLKQLVTVET